MAIVLIRNPDGSEQEKTLEGELTIGRAEGNDLVLIEGGVSRRHARLFVQKGSVRVEDSGSANGTFLDGALIEGSKPMGPESVVVIGEYELRLLPEQRPRTSGSKQLPEPRATRAVKAIPGDGAALARRPRPGGAPKAEGPSLRGLTGPWLDQLFPLRGVMTVGRVANAEIFLEDDSVSRRHAEVEVTPEGVVVRDLESANGTSVNGVRTSDEVLLQKGDVLQFGVIELALEAPSALGAPARRGGLARGAASAQAPADSSVGRKRLLVYGGLGLGVFLGLAGLGKVLLKGVPTVTTPTPGQVATPEPAATIDELLAECRSFSSPELREPDWGRAETACNKALDLDPIHPEALSLRKKIRSEQECASNYTKADRELQRLDEKKALELFGKIPPECSYYLKAKPKVRQAIDDVMKATSRDCRTYAGNDQWSEALPPCELYMKFACQNMGPGELRPPLNHTLSLASGRLKKGQWRPKDSMYLTFLRVRAKLDPDAPAWQCPPMAIMRKEKGPPDPREEVRKVFGQRYPERDLAASLEFYFEGRSGDAINLLQRVRERQEKAPYHAISDELRKDITLVQQLYNEGEANLQAMDPEKAAVPFTEALSVDKKLMKELTEKTPSFFRRNMLLDMGSKSFERGKSFAERGDVRRGCRVWKLGYSFYKGNVDLLQALSNTCIHRAMTAFEEATSCEDLTKVEDFAVEGDGLAQRISDKRKELSCTPPAP